MKKPIILGIETSCDETAAAVVAGGTKILSNVISSQVDIHRQFGGVVPEIASRKHIERITVIIQEALDRAGLRKEDLDAVAVTQGPGLVGALLIGITAAKAVAFSIKKPLIAVHHIAGHIYANHLVEPLQFPLVSLVVSGGHTELIYMDQHNQFQKLGKTRDDAAGEAFDKVARLLQLPYPGGPEIDRLAAKGEPKYAFPRAWLEDESADFSFSGLKSAVSQFLQKNRSFYLPDLACSFQEAVVEVLVEKSISAVKRMNTNRLLLAGGVSANRFLRKQLQQRCEKEGIILLIPPMELCTDNAAMIAAAGTYNYYEGKVADLSLNANPSLPLSAKVSKIK